MRDGDPTTTWGVGEYPRMAERLEGVARRIVDRAGATAEDRVLDVACGTGNVALLAAERGARATGVDFEPRLLALARERAEAAGLEVELLEGDVGALPVSEGAFTAVVSAFGVMYAPAQGAAARELARACAPNARVVLASWVPGDFMPAMGGALAPYLPQPPGDGPPTRWGDEEELAVLLDSAGISLEETAREQLTLEFSDRDEAVEFLVRTAGHVLAERARLEAEGRWTELVSALAALVEERDAGAGDGVSLRLEYLLAVGAPLLDGPPAS